MQTWNGSRVSILLSTWHLHPHNFRICRFYLLNLEYNLLRLITVYCCAIFFSVCSVSALLILRRACCWSGQQGQRHASFLKASCLTVPDWRTGRKRERTPDQRRLQTKSLQRHYKDPYRTAVSCMHREIPSRILYTEVAWLMGFTWIQNTGSCRISVREKRTDLKRGILYCCVRVFRFRLLKSEYLLISWDSVFSQIGFNV